MCYNTQNQFDININYIPANRDEDHMPSCWCPRVLCCNHRLCRLKLQPLWITETESWCNQFISTILDVGMTESLLAKAEQHLNQEPEVWVCTGGWVGRRLVSVSTALIRSSRKQRSCENSEQSRLKIAKQISRAGATVQLNLQSGSVVELKPIF